MGMLLALIPDHGLVLLTMILGLGAALGVVGPGTFRGFAGSVLLLLIGGPVIAAFVGGLAPGWQLLILLGMAVMVIRTVLTFLLGRGATDRLVAHLAYDLVVLPFRVLAAILRAVLDGGRAGR